MSLRFHSLRFPILTDKNQLADFVFSHLFDMISYIYPTQ